MKIPIELKTKWVKALRSGGKPKGFRTIANYIVKNIEAY